MKKKIIKLTELDLENLVKRILKEDYAQEMRHDQEEMDEVWRLLSKLSHKMNNNDLLDMMERTFNDGSMSVESFVSHLPTYFGYDEKYLISILNQIKKEGI
jgi:hypothetical protein